MKQGDRIHGFAVREVRPFSSGGASLVLMEHEKTGAKLAWVDRRDDNMTFSIGFKTIPWNDTGVFHILEHSVLNGSRKYPLHEPFVELLKGSLQTFLNAMTAPDHTVYPVSSRNQKDLLNLMDVYLDAVLHPAIMTNPNIFRQEGWHYQIHGENEDPVYNGVVFNEMKGAFSSVDETIYNGLNRLLYPDACYRYVSGGDPRHIPDLTYEQFLAAHRKFYHPSNAYVMLDGSVDVAACLEKIDGFFSAYEKRDMNISEGFQERIPGKEATAEYEIAESESPEGKEFYEKAKIIGDCDEALKITALKAVGSLLTESPQAPLTRAVLESGCGKDVDVAVMDGIRQPYVAIDVRNCSERDFGKVDAVVESALRECVRGGLDHGKLRSWIDRMEFSPLDRKEPAGLYNERKLLAAWLYGKDPMTYLDPGDLYDRLRGQVEKGYFEKLVEEMLLDRKGMSVLKVVPSKEIGKKEMEAEKERLRAEKASWKDVGEYVRQTEELERYQNTPDTKEALESLPSLDLSDIREQPLEYPAQEAEAGGIPLRLYPEDSGQIRYANFWFDVGKAAEEDLPKIALLCSLYTNLATKEHSLGEVQQILKERIGSLSITPAALCPHEDPKLARVMILVSVSMLKKNEEEAVKFLQEVLTQTVWDKELIRPQVEMAKESGRQALIASGTQVAMLRVQGAYSSAGAVNERLLGYSFYEWISGFAGQFDRQFEAFRAFAEGFAPRIFTRKGCSVSLSGEAPGWLAEFPQGLPEGEQKIREASYEVLPPEDEGIEIPSGVSYSACGKILEKKYEGSLQTAAKALSLGYLWNRVRVQGGAYGTWFSARPTGLAECCSFRDPSPEKSLKVYEGCGECVKGFGESLKTYIIGTIASSEPVLSPLGKMELSDARSLCGIDHERLLKERREILHTDEESFRMWAEPVGKAMREGKKVVVGPLEKLEGIGLKTIHRAK